eukprot:TRINITY_DN19168_c0_g2_i1.p1 TRINITY_DN19168_c0_g2~~TRINITY_DN19168_c0_g2_i1.p1  ORF type:complete len:110 (+),score=15.29 TRINITY_DN19168_c0_g2_i1:22-330(+)
MCIRDRAHEAINSFSRLNANKNRNSIKTIIETMDNPTQNHASLPIRKLRARERIPEVISSFHNPKNATKQSHYNVRDKYNKVSNELRDKLIQIVQSLSLIHI